MYLSAAQVGSTSQWLVARTAGDPNLISDSIRRLLRELDREVVFSNPRTMESIVSASLTGVRSVTLALTLLAGIALLLTSVGIYGVLAYNVNQRKGEFGLRVTLGAQTPQLLVMAVTRGLRLVSAGLALGVILSIFGTGVLQSFLYQTDRVDPTVILGATVFLGVIALGACLLPAWRAVRVDPVEVLRRD
jgi:ABC-type antimicrobial peptide transport system permease subunit